MCNIPDDREKNPVPQKKGRYTVSCFSTLFNSVSIDVYYSLDFHPQEFLVQFLISLYSNDIYLHSIHISVITNSGAYCAGERYKSR